MMGTEIFEIDASWAEKLRKTRVPFLMTPTVYTNIIIEMEKTLSIVVPPNILGVLVL